MHPWNVSRFNRFNLFNRCPHSPVSSGPRRLIGELAQRQIYEKSARGASAQSSRGPESRVLECWVLIDPDVGLLDGWIFKKMSEILLKVFLSFVALTLEAKTFRQDLGRVEGAEAQVRVDGSRGSGA